MVPGGMNDPFMPAMTETAGLRPVVAAHEGGAAYMADGYGRASGRLGVAFAAFDSSAGEAVANVISLAGTGVGHAGAEAALAAVAERFEIPVASTLLAKGVLPEDHPLSLGVFGYGGARWATEAILDPSVEVLLVV